LVRLKTTIGMSPELRERVANSCVCYSKGAALTLLEGLYMWPLELLSEEPALVYGDLHALRRTSRIGEGEVTFSVTPKDEPA
jgi:hypothetical protein